MKPPHPRDYPRANHRWAHFEIAHEIARGNMGVVFRARDTRTDKDVALKVLIGGHDDEESLERFKREARSLARLSHKGIVGVHSYGVQDGIPFLTMEYVPGTTLQKLLEARALTVARMADTIAQVARAVDHAHSRGVLHRDLKPANILIGADGQAKVTDFGLARLSDSKSLTHDGDLVGTPVFMSPEQIQGNLFALGPSSDVWALGVTLYQCLVGILPFVGQTVEEVGRQIVHAEPRPPRQILTSIPEDLERICLAALEKDPLQRYRSAQEVARDLEAYMRGEQVLAGQVTLGVRARRTLRYLRLHAAAAGVAATGAVLVLLILGLAASRWAASAENTARVLTTDAFLGRSAAGKALENGRDAWREQSPRLAWEEASNALDEARRAAAYLDRAAHHVEQELLLQEALDRPPHDDEVTRGLDRDPTLARLRREGVTLRGWALSRDPGLESLDPTAELEAGYPQAPQLETLSALLRLAERRGDDALAARTHARIWAAGPPAEAPQGAALVGLRAWAARLDVACPACTQAQPAAGDPCVVCEHACGAGGPTCARCGIDPAWAEQAALRRPIRLAVARQHASRGDPFTAWASMPPADGAADADELLLRARLARRLGDTDAALAALAQLDASARGDRRAQVALERAQELASRGLPRAARAVIAALDVQPSLPLRRALQRLDAALALLLDDDAGAATLSAQLADVDTPGDRLAAARWLRLHERAVDPPAPTSRQPQLRLLQAELLRLEQTPAITGQLALRGLRLAGVDAERIAQLDLARGDGGALLAASAGLREPVLLQSLAELAGPSGVPGWSELPKPLRLALERQPEEVAGAPLPVGLRHGRLALARALELLEGETRDSEVDALLHRAHRLLRLARRAAPCHAGVRLALARLHLLRADAPAARAQSARRSALVEAAAAVALAQRDPRARSLLWQAWWVNDPGVDLRALLETWEGGALEPYEVLALRHVAATYAGQAAALAEDDDHDAVLAQRLVVRLIRAAPRLGGEAPAAVAPELGMFPPPPPGLAGTERALREARALLEQPQRIDLVLAEPTPLLDEKGVRTLKELLHATHADARDGVRSAAARVALLLQSLRQSAAAGLDPVARRLFRVQARVDLELLAWQRPSLALAPLQALVMIWGGADRAALDDLLATPWDGELYTLLDALRTRAGAPQGGADAGLLRWAPLKRLALEATTSSSTGSSGGRGGG